MLTAFRSKGRAVRAGTDAVGCLLPPWGTDSCMSCVSLLFILDIVCLFSHTSSKPWGSPVFILQSLLSTCIFSFREAMMRKGLTSGMTASPSLCCFSSAVFKAFLFSIQICFADCLERGKTHCSFDGPSFWPTDMQKTPERQAQVQHSAAQQNIPRTVW